MVGCMASGGEEVEKGGLGQNRRRHLRCLCIEVRGSPGIGAGAGGGVGVPERSLFCLPEELLPLLDTPSDPSYLGVGEFTSAGSSLADSSSTDSSSAESSSAQSGLRIS